MRNDLFWGIVSCGEWLVVGNGLLWGGFVVGNGLLWRGLL